jgi:hypothetical protein
MTNVLETIASQENFDQTVKDFGGLSATTLDAVQEILKLDSEKYSDDDLVQLISQAVKFHFDHVPQA